jgi:N,N'-diacetyllegionaminate synthase
MSHCEIVAEVGQAHDGSLGTAHAYIDAAARAGADAVKFQSHLAAAESTPAEPWRVRFSLQDETRYDYWRRMEFTEQQWDGLRAHAHERGLRFICSPFSIEAVEMLERVGVDAYKVASGEVSNVVLLERIIDTGRPVVLSSGMSTLDELDRAVELARGAPLTVLQCTSSYPCPPEKLGLNLITVLRERYDVPVGLSDHSGTIFAGLAAATLGAAMVEVHITFSREAFGPDVSSSITIDELAQLVEGTRFVTTANANPVDKDAAAGELDDLRRLFTKSVVARGDLPAGTLLSEEHLATKKPGTGIPADRLPALIGRRLARSVRADELLADDDLEPVR